ncbi:unnamed protein product [Adineta steineri]|uniref:N-acetyltransferase domain-containing protein n=1 Tax=Adineta steineri TaxID=433720 RepID=A0A818TWA3_9BILA|nr:unnamed protein product [Adineta steineri]CAF1215960.1 unnamed protein product [Adineta steineri]CAF3689870.1 unnamed protein product [Adineta steineri]CAF3771230.1 unnamed protein product [Adineta steineri]
MISSTKIHLNLPNKEAYLELIQPEHIDQLYQLLESNRKYLQKNIPGIDSLQTRDDLQRRWGTSKENSLHFGLWLNKNQLIGRCRLTRDVNTCSADIGYWISESFQGKGLMTSAVEQLIKFAFEKWNIKRMEIHCGVNNLKSRAIPERLGFSNEGISQMYPSILLNGQMLESIVYSKNNSIEK